MTDILDLPDLTPIGRRHEGNESGPNCQGIVGAAPINQRSRPRLLSRGDPMGVAGGYCVLGIRDVDGDAMKRAQQSTGRQQVGMTKKANTPEWAEEYVTMLNECDERGDRLADWEWGSLGLLRWQIKNGEQLSARQIGMLKSIWEKATAKG